ncbi:hypothetical protein EDD22DRAFT_869486 [Suillus occidentalis]|nr:hypothetical protein EDD22DRAFT_869486 [Suillus occidentalis]
MTLLPSSPAILLLLSIPFVRSSSPSLNGTSIASRYYGARLPLRQYPHQYVSFCCLAISSGWTIRTTLALSHFWLYSLALSYILLHGLHLVY